MLHKCCGSVRWVDGMLARRPFGNTEALRAAARDVWWSLSPDDWREAFAHHPKIGDRSDLRRRFAATAHLSEREQAGVAGADEAVLGALARGNGEYEARFGFIFIVRAAGRTAPELLTLLRARLRNSPEDEVRVAAEEQVQITELRLLGL